MYTDIYIYEYTYIYMHIYIYHTDHLGLSHPCLWETYTCLWGMCVFTCVWSRLQARPTLSTCVQVFGNCTHTHTHTSTHTRTHTHTHTHAHTHAHTRTHAHVHAHTTSYVWYGSPTNTRDKRGRRGCNWVESHSNSTSSYFCDVANLLIYVQDKYMKWRNHSYNHNMAHSLICVTGEEREDLHNWVESHGNVSSSYICDVANLLLHVKERYGTWLTHSYARQTRKAKTCTTGSSHTANFHRHMFFTWLTYLYTWKTNMGHGLLTNMRDRRGRRRPAQLGRVQRQFLIIIYLWHG